MTLRTIKILLVFGVAFFLFPRGLQQSHGLQLELLFCAAHADHGHHVPGKPRDVAVHPLSILVHGVLLVHHRLGVRRHVPLLVGWRPSGASDSGKRCSIQSGETDFDRGAGAEFAQMAYRVSIRGGRVVFVLAVEALERAGCCISDVYGRGNRTGAAGDAGCSGPAMNRRPHESTNLRIRSFTADMSMFFSQGTDLTRRVRPC